MTTIYFIFSFIIAVLLGMQIEAALIESRMRKATKQFETLLKMKIEEKDKMLSPSKKKKPTKKV